MSRGVRAQAVELLGESLSRDDRVLVLGASGWFGRTMLALLSGLGSVQVLALASRARQMPQSSRFHVAAWDEYLVESFGPTVVVNFAFLTRDKWAEGHDAEYRQVNELLISRLLWSTRLPSVRAALTVSSGAAVSAGSDGDGNPYGVLKAAEERAVLQSVAEHRSVLVARAWSVSGPFVRDPRKYLFSDLILQARAGLVTLRAERPVYRRYVSVDDYLSVCLTRALRGVSGVVDSGGPLVEARDLARRVADRLGAAVEFPNVFDESRPDLYYSDDVGWSEAVAAQGYCPASLDEQIEIVSNHLPVDGSC